MSEKAIVFYCKTCGALFFAVMQSAVGSHAQEIAEYLEKGDRMEIVDPEVIPIAFSACHCYDDKSNGSMPKTGLPLFESLEAQSVCTERRCDA